MIDHGPLLFREGFFFPRLPVDQEDFLAAGLLPKFFIAKHIPGRHVLAEYRLIELATRGAGAEPFDVLGTLRHEQFGILLADRFAPDNVAAITQVPLCKERIEQEFIVGQPLEFDLAGKVHERLHQVGARNQGAKFKGFAHGGIAPPAGHHHFSDDLAHLIGHGIVFAVAAGGDLEGQAVLALVAGDDVHHAADPVKDGLAAALAGQVGFPLLIPLIIGHHA